MKKKYSKFSNIKLNNFALGDKNEIKTFNIFAKNDTSSFLKLNDSEWVNVRRKQLVIKKNKFLKSKLNTKVQTLDEYMTHNKIDKIDILKLDTQGYEKKILDGAKKI